MAILNSVFTAPASDLAVIFVHGLNGHPEKTWMHTEHDPVSLWPRWLGEDLGCSVWLLGYDAALSRWTGNAMPLPDQGDAVLECLYSEPGLRDKRLLLIGHSMGGLVIKTLIVHGRSKGTTRHAGLVQRISGIVFIATPHKGSDLASIARLVALGLRTNPQVGNMSNHDAHLRTLHQQFLAYQRETLVPVRTYAETHGMLLGKRLFGINLGKHQLVVDPDSAEPHVAGETAIRLPANHASICKLPDRNQTLYKSLCIFIREEATPYQPSHRLPSTTPPPPPTTVASAIRTPAQALLEQKLSDLYAQHAVETRPEEKRRIQWVIDQTERELQTRRPAV